MKINKSKVSLKEQMSNTKAVDSAKILGGKTEHHIINGPDPRPGKRRL